MPCAAGFWNTCGMIGRINGVGIAVGVTVGVAVGIAVGTAATAAAVALLLAATGSGVVAVTVAVLVMLPAGAWALPRTTRVRVTVPPLANDGAVNVTTAGGPEPTAGETTAKPGSGDTAETNVVLAGMGSL